MPSEPKKINFVFFGTSEEATYALDALFDRGFIPSLIVTTPDRPVGRKQILTGPLAKQWAEKHRVNFIQPEKVDAAAREEIAKINFDLFVVVGYGKILPQSLIDMPPHGVINVHTSLLPLHRGPTPIEGPILSGDNETGVTVMLIDKDIDHGPIIYQEPYPLIGNETTPDLTRILFTRGGELLADIIPNWIAGNIESREQDHSLASFTKKLSKQDGLVDIANDDPQIIWRKYRAYMGWPGIYFMDSNNKRVKITKARFENGKFIIERVIREGKPESNY